MPTAFSGYILLTRVGYPIKEKIRYLNPEEQHYVINNIIPEGLDISKLTESIANFKPNPLTLDYVHGLFESNTNNYKKDFEFSNET